jgi:spermidine/putrescine transport system ATP-binding protein
MMRSIKLENITKSFHGDIIVENIQLLIPSGKIFALLGPSGCGKTTLLRLIGGFEAVDEGKIFLGQTDITHMPINQRRINTVFQNYALFPHLNVFENIAYSLTIKGASKDEIYARVLKVVKAVHLESHINKAITQLSGGQQQRVALARALINEPDVLLLDEPLAALDFKLREKLLIDLIALQEQLGMTFIYVTHDPFEALTVADQMAIMNHNGEIEQIGTPKEIYEFPQSSFVAKFVGTTNIIHGSLQDIKDNQASFEIRGLGAFAVYIPQKKGWMIESAKALMSIRPEKIFISKRLQQGFSNHLTGVVESIVYNGRSTGYVVRLKNDNRLQVFEQNEEHFPQDTIDYDDVVNLYWQKENVVLLER